MDLIDVFAGCGGITEGFRRAGFNSVMAVEWDRSAAATYASNFGDHVECSDITKLPDDAFPSADVVVGGPPCQGFSNLGRRDPADPRNLLWQEYARVVRSVRPRVFVLENVPQFLKSDQFQLFVEWTRNGCLSEYELAAGILNAADYGVPQRRRRAIVIGAKRGQVTLPPSTHGQNDQSMPWVTVRDAFRGVPFETGPTTLPGQKLKSGIPGPFKVSELHLSRRPQKISLQRYVSFHPAVDGSTCRTIYSRTAGGTNQRELWT